MSITYIPILEIDAPWDRDYKVEMKKQ